MPFLTVDATLGNQAFSHDGCNVFPGLSYNETDNTFLNSLRKNEVEAQTNLREKLWKGMGTPVIDDVTVKKDSLLVYVLNFFGILAGRCGSVVVRERDRIRKVQVRVLPWVVIYFLFNRKTFNTGQKFSRCLKNGSEGLRKGQMRR